jgi:hypothetical protein
MSEPRRRRDEGWAEEEGSGGEARRATHAQRQMNSRTMTIIPSREYAVEDQKEE